MVFVLSLAGASTGALQRVLTLFGVTMACSVVLANLGSRSWLFLRWKPLSLGGPVEPVIAFFAAIAAGIVVPYMGHRKVEAGGKVAILSVLKSALIVAIVFVISDYDGIQRILVVGSEVSVFLFRHKDDACVYIFWPLRVLLNILWNTCSSPTFFPLNRRVNRIS